MLPQDLVLLEELPERTASRTAHQRGLIEQAVPDAGIHMGRFPLVKKPLLQDCVKVLELVALCVGIAGVHDPPWL